MDDTKAREVLRTIQEEAKGHESDLRFVRVCGPGDEIRQGDIYLYPLAEPPDAQDEGPELSDRQLAPGTTKGSRHIMTEGARVYRQYSRDPLAGPFVNARRRVVLTHPEHADISLPAGWYEVRYQRDYSGPAPRKFRRRNIRRRDIRRVYD